MNNNIKRNIKHIMQCCYACKDYIKMKEFYSKTLELKEKFSIAFTPELINYFIKKGFACKKQPGEECASYFSITDDEYIVLLNIQYNDDSDHKNEGFYHICLMVEDIFAVARDLEKKGIQLWEGPSYENRPYNNPYKGDVPQPCHSLVFFIQDPEGNEIEIMQFTKESLQILNDFE